MKHHLPVLILTVILLNACTPAPSSPVDDPRLQASPTLQATSESSVPVLPTATSTTTPTLTPVPVPDLWHWAYDTNLLGIYAVNLSGESHLLGELDLVDARNYLAIPLDDESALLLLATDSSLRLYLLGSDSMQPIRMPASYLYDGNMSPGTMASAGIFNRNIVFTYATRQSMGGHGGNDMPSSGPAFHVDTTSLAAQVIDTNVIYDSWTDTRRWFYASEDGRFVRYLNGDPSNMQVREVDLQTGETRTIASTTKSPFSILASPVGDLWFLRNSGLIVDLDGNQAAFSDTTRRFRPLAEGRGISMPIDCTAPCTLQVVTPFGSDPVLNYTLPWNIKDGIFFPRLSQVLPDQSLLFAGGSDSLVGNTSSTLEMYPGLLDDDEPLFRLSPDGEARLLGAYRDYEFSSSGRHAVSPDGNYILLKKPDQSEFFIYDVLADRALFSLPIETGLDYFYSTLQFEPQGILLHLTAATPDDQYRDFYSLYRYETKTAFSWEDLSGMISSCPDMYSDGSLACWIYNEINTDLVRYDPVSGIKIPLLENVWTLEYAP